MSWHTFFDNSSFKCYYDSWRLLFFPRFCWFCLLLERIYLIQNMVTKYSRELHFSPVSKFCSSSHSAPTELSNGHDELFQSVVKFYGANKIRKVGIGIYGRPNARSEEESMTWHVIECRSYPSCPFQSLSRPHNKLICDTWRWVSTYSLATNEVFLFLFSITVKILHMSCIFLVDLMQVVWGFFLTKAIIFASEWFLHWRISPFLANWSSFGKAGQVGLDSRPWRWQGTKD